jgi:hypothetical protein
MLNNNEELETSKNPEEGKTLEGDTSQNESTENVEELKNKIAGLEDKLSQSESANKQLFERTQKSTLKAKELEAENFAKENKIEKTNDPLESLRLYSALKDYSKDEIDIISRQARALETNLIEAAEHEDTQVLINAYRAKVEKDNTTPSPNSRQDMSEKGFDEWSPEDIKKLTQNPTKENINKLDEYRRYMRTKRRS